MFGFWCCTSEYNSFPDKVYKIVPSRFETFEQSLFPLFISLLAYFVGRYITSSLLPSLNKHNQFDLLLLFLVSVYFVASLLHLLIFLFSISLLVSFFFFLIAETMVYAKYMYNIITWPLSTNWFSQYQNDVKIAQDWLGLRKKLQGFARVFT